MSKVILKFTKPWGRFNAGEIAGFEKETAQRLTNPKNPVAKLHGDGKPKMTALDMPVGNVEVEKILKTAKADLDKRENDLATREAEAEQKAEALVDRSADLDAREVALKEAEAAAAASATPAKAAAAPPAQGKK